MSISRLLIKPRGAFTRPIRAARSPKVEKTLTRFTQIIDQEAHGFGTTVKTKTRSHAYETWRLEPSLHRHEWRVSLTCRLKLAMFPYPFASKDPEEASRGNFIGDNHPDGDVEKLLRVVWSSRTSYRYCDLQIVKELYRRFILLLCLRTDAAFWARSVTSCPQPTTSGRLLEERQRWHFVDVFCNIHCFF
jgi:hypothetical protein